MKQYTSWIVVGLMTLIIIGGILWYINTPGKYDTFAKCISDKKAVFYGAFWCSHCQEQKTLFGKSAKFLPYVECSTSDGQGQLQACKDKNISGYPTWDFVSDATTTRKTQMLTFSELSELTSCVLTDK